MCDTKNYFNQIKSIQDLLRKKGLQKYYQSAILGFTVLRRLTQTLDSTRDAVVLEYEEMVANNEEIDADLLISIANEKFYNITRFNFENLLNDPQHIYANVTKMIRGFSDNIYEILGNKGLNLEEVVAKINEKKILYAVIEKYSKLDFSRENMSNTNMGALFGELVVLLYGTPENGENWTPDDFVKCCTRLLLAEGCEWIKTGTHSISVCDHAIGSGQLLSYLDQEIHRINPDCMVQIYGQDNQELNIAICKAEQLMLGRDISHLYVADSLKEDKFTDLMDFSIQNAPYGCGREKEDEKAIKNYLGEDLPSSGDNQMLFWKAAINKLKPTGRAVLLSNGSPLFSGGTLSGESKIRKWLFDNDRVEAIVKLIDQGFLDTGITIYAWVINMNKPTHRKNKIQLIDGSSFWHPMKKSVGQKRKNMEDEDIEKIVELYTSFEENEYCKILDKEDFYYYQVTIQQPYQRNFKICEERIENLYSQKTFTKLFDEDKYQELLDEVKTPIIQSQITLQLFGKQIQEEVIAILRENSSEQVWINRDDFTNKIKKLFSTDDFKYKSLIKCIVDALSEPDKTSETYKTKKGEYEPDTSLNDTEYVPYKESVEEYFQREVKPFVPDAWYVKDYQEKVGCEINFNKYFYKYQEPRNTDVILEELESLNSLEKNLMEVLLSE